MGIREFTLESDHQQYGTVIAIGKEVEQKLSVNDSGRVSFIGFGYEGLQKKSITRRIQLTIPEESLREVFSAMQYFLDGKYASRCVIRSGKWKLRIVDSDGNEQFFFGSLKPGILGDPKVDEALKTYVPIDGLIGFEDESV